MSVLATRRNKASRFSTALLKSLGQETLTALGRGDDELSLSIVGPRTMRSLNREWRQEDEPTDVLSFPMLEGDPLPGVNACMLGDVVICESVLLDQAQRYGATPLQELVRLVVHGVLHCVGHDHGEAEEAQRMQDAAEPLQARVYASLMSTFGDPDAVPAPRSGE